MTDQTPDDGHRLEEWLQNVALPSYDAYKSDPASGLSFDEVKRDMAKLHEQALIERA